MVKSVTWNLKVETYFSVHFRDAPDSLDYYLRLWREHQSAGLASDHFVSELTGGCVEKLWQRIWEMLLGRHLRACGHEIVSRPEGEPDYCLKVGDQKVWIEAISPAPGPDLPGHWKTSDASNSYKNVETVPHKQILLRWTSALNAKAKKYLEYRNKGVVRLSDAFVIAIDGSQLSKLPLTHGISQRPFVVESAFATGPWAVEVDNATGKIARSFQTVEPAIENRNKAPVSKDVFLRYKFPGISAVLGCYARIRASGMLPVQIAYNPSAECSMPRGYFGAEAEEWTAELLWRNTKEMEWSIQKNKAISNVSAMTYVPTLKS